MDGMEGYTDEEIWAAEEEYRYWEEYRNQANLDWQAMRMMMHEAAPETIVAYLEAAVKNGAYYLEYVSRPVDPNPPF